MKVSFRPGRLVKFKVPDGAFARINVKKSWDWNVPGYLGDGFYEVEVEGRLLIAHEDDLVLADFVPTTSKEACEFLLRAWQYLWNTRKENGGVPHRAYSEAISIFQDTLVTLRRDSIGVKGQ